MPKKFVYAVAAGRKTGVFETWGEAKALVEGFEGARFKKFESRTDAEAFVRGNGSVVLGQLGVRMEVAPLTASSSLQTSPHAADTIVAFTDGSAIRNGHKDAKAGWAVVFPNHPQLNTSAPLTGDQPKTNNRAEYTALLECLNIVDAIDPTGASRVVVYTDSKLLLQSVTRWMSGWKRNHWRKADGTPVLNQDLLQALDGKLQRRRIEMHHVLAHTGRNDWRSQWNDAVDRMARAAAEGS
jgi:ribonuclease HI